MKKLLILLTVVLFLSASDVHKLNTSNINTVKEELYSDITDKSINNSISKQKAREIKNNLDMKFDETLANYKYNLKKLALKIANLDTEYQNKKDEYQKNKTSLENKLSEKKAKETTILNIQKDIKNSKNNQITPNTTKEFSTQGYYISVIKIPLSVSNKQAKNKLQNGIINQSIKDLRGQFLKSLKIIKNSKIVTNKIVVISSGKVNIINSSSNNIYSFNHRGKKIVIYTTKVELYPFEKSSTSVVETTTNHNSKNVRVFLIEDTKELKSTILAIKNSFGIHQTNIDKQSVIDELTNIDKHNNDTYNSIKKIITDFQNSKMQINHRISLSKQKLMNEKQSLLLINQEIKFLTEQLNEENKYLISLKKGMESSTNKLKKLKSQQIYTRAMMEDTKSSNPKQDLKNLIEELVSEIDVSFKQTSKEIEEVVNQNKYSKKTTKIKYLKTYISAQIIPYYVEGSGSKIGAIVVLKVKFSKNSAKSYNDIGNKYYYKKEYKKITVINSKNAKLSNDDRGNKYSDKIIEVNSKSAMAYNDDRGNKYSNNKEYDNYYNNVGVEYYYTKEYDKAIKWYKKAIETNPKDSYIYNRIGFIYYIENDYYNAISWYKKAIKINPNNKLFQYNLKNAQNTLKYYNSLKDAQEKLDSLNEY